MTDLKKALELHEKWAGKITIEPNCPVATKEDLAMAYTPGVAEPCKEIAEDVSLSYKYTRRWNTVAVVSDGTAVLGLGDIGPEASMPVMEGKAVLFKAFGNVDAIPLCVRTKDVDEIVRTVELLAGSFGGVNLEDIAAPACFEIEEKLKKVTDIPIFHDDQHGTAVVILSGIINALKLVKKDISDIKVVFSGAGAAGMATAKLLNEMGAGHIIMSDSKGCLYKGRAHNNKYHEEILNYITSADENSTLADALKDADVFIGVSAPNIVSKEMIESMADNAIVFALANPVPEIGYNDAKAAGAAVVATGRSDFPNQINNVLAFPGIFRGTLDCRASEINNQMKIAAAHAIASLVSDEELSDDYIIPDAFNKDVAKAVAESVKKAAVETKVARI